MQVYPCFQHKPLVGGVCNFPGLQLLLPAIVFQGNLQLWLGRSMSSSFPGPRAELPSPVSPEWSRGAESPLTCCPRSGDEPRTQRGFCLVHSHGRVCPILHPPARQVLLLGLNPLITQPVSCMSGIAPIQGLQILPLLCSDDVGELCKSLGYWEQGRQDSGEGYPGHGLKDDPWLKVWDSLCP